MRAVLVPSPGAVPYAGRYDDPPAGDRQQLVSLVAAGLHPIVRSLAAGRHYGSQGSWPLIPGVDAVARTADGRLVYTGYTTPPYGTFAELMAVPQVLPLPEDADETAAVQVAASMNPGLSSWLPLRQAQQAGPLGVVWVLGATGAAGALAVHNARELGAGRVVAVGRRAERLEALPADAVIVLGDRAEQDVAAFAQEASAARPTVVLDFVWGPVAEAALRGLVRGTLDEDGAGTSYVEIGESAGAAASVPAASLRSAAVTLRGSGAGSVPVSEIVAELPGYLARVCAGRVRLPVATFPLADIAAAWAHDRPGVRAVIVP